MSYKYTCPIVDPYHFIPKYIRYASSLTDASHHYHEAMALFLLSVASHGLRFPLPTSPKGLRGNLYMIQYGFSSVTRKSTCMDIAKDIQERAMPGVALPPAFTPGGLEEELAIRSGQASGLFVDEFSRVLDQMHHQSFMSGLRGFLLTLYGQEEWEYRRTAKGRNKTKDLVKIENSNLCIAGNVTPTLTKYFQPRDIEDGFLARFAIIWPHARPPRKVMGDLSLDTRARNDLVQHLSRMRSFAKAIDERQQEGHPDYLREMEWVKADPYAITTIDRFQESIERQVRRIDTGSIMVERIGIMAFKIAMLIAFGSPGIENKRVLTVEHEHAVAAVEIAKNWKHWAVRFADSLYESPIEKHVRRVESLLENHGPDVPRWFVAKKMRLSRRELDEVQMTLCDRGSLRLEERCIEDSKKPSLFWIKTDPVTTKDLEDYEAGEKSTPEAGRDNPGG